jgi:hypothetical protein
VVFARHESDARRSRQLDREVSEGAMADLLNLAMLICASAGAVGFSILAAYGILRVGFALMRPARRPAKESARQQVVSAS